MFSLRVDLMNYVYILDNLATQMFGFIDLFGIS